MRAIVAQTAILFALICVTSAPAIGRADLATCASHLKKSPRLDGKLIGAMFSWEPGKGEEMVAWLDQYCPTNPNETLVSAIRKFLTETQH